jgi:hypothetical protein
LNDRERHCDTYIGGRDACDALRYHVKNLYCRR